ncbi:BON domain-containing protein [Enterobacter ludwigii]|uniref:BON domain-containing protein n=1 Tax=Enterobacteriaceae TaxID=543 RepID=UPI001BD348B1|nr:BON domain-containing protein [Enterobacter ludwigii]EHN8908266.1 BON domain-containing protein [Enterobacter hormaechei]WGA03965.1 BON domain-containing protein [Enterobacter ludwigii]
MGRIKSVNTLCLSVIFSVLLAGCAPGAKKEGTGGYIDDTVITTKVKAALLAEKSLKSTEINVETFKGRVQLSGFVSSSDAVKKAVAVTQKVSGVQAVENDMRIR